MEDFQRSGQVYVVIKSTMISSMDVFIRQNCQITTCKVSVELSITEGSVQTIIHKYVGYDKICAIWMPMHQSQSVKKQREWSFA